MPEECKWSDRKEDLNEPVLYHEPSLMAKSHRMTVETVFRDFVVPFFLWQHNRDFAEAMIKDHFEENTGVLPKNIRAGDRCGEKNSDIVIEVSGFRTSFVPISFVSEKTND